MSRRNSEDGIIEFVDRARIAEIKASNYWPGRGLTEELVYTIETLMELLAEATDWQHSAGCSGNLDAKYPCKCGFRYWEKKVKEILGGENERDQEETQLL